MKLTKQDNEPEELEVEMTPMIDVVFLLIVFFMIVVDLTQQDLVLLQLPPSEMGEKDKNPEKNRVTVNITWDPETKTSDIVLKRNTFTLDELKDWLYPIANSKLNPKTKLSEIPILIRCDEDAPFRKVQEVMQICADKDIKIYKVLIAAADVSEQK